MAIEKKKQPLSRACILPGRSQSVLSFPLVIFGEGRCYMGARLLAGLNPSGLCSPSEGQRLFWLPSLTQSWVLSFTPKEYSRSWT